MEENFFRSVLQQFQGFFSSMNDLCIEEMKKSNIPSSQGTKNHQKAQGTGQRVKKDPDAPKNPRSAYIYFCQHIRQKYPDRIKEVPFSQQSTVMGREWAKLSDAKKENFVQLSEKDRKRYDLEQAEWDKQRGIVSKPLKRKRPQVQNNCQSEEERESIPGDIVQIDSDEVQDQESVEEASFEEYEVVETLKKKQKK